MRSASVYQRKSSLFVVPYSRNTDGIWFSDGECTTLSSDAEDAEVGDAVLRALARSRSGVDIDLRKAKGLFDPVLEAAGVRGWKPFVYGTSSVDVEQDGDTLGVTPFRNDGARGGFEPLADARLVVLAPTPEALGAAVRRGLQLCE